MGMIRIQTDGSFGESEIVFRAIGHGHAHCVNKAMIYLQDVMRKAINSDHRLHEQGVKPQKGFSVE